MSIDALRGRLPAYAKDIGANLAVLAEETVLSPQAKWGCFVASACAVGEPETLKAVTAAAREAGLTEEGAAARTAAAIMAMNNVYFRALHLMETPEYRSLPSKLRMNRLAHHPGVETVDYELWCVAVSAINACGACLDSHEAELRARGVAPPQVQAALRIAAVVHAASRVLAVETVDHPPFSGVSG
jgi:alkyl hydroperoxide reductase subunit D